MHFTSLIYSIDTRLNTLETSNLRIGNNLLNSIVMYIQKILEKPYWRNMMYLFWNSCRSYIHILLSQIATIVHYFHEFRK